MPSASARIAAVVKPRSRRSTVNAYFRSLTIASMARQYGSAAAPQQLCDGLRHAADAHSAPRRRQSCRGGAFSRRHGRLRTRDQRVSVERPLLLARAMNRFLTLFVVLTLALAPIACSNSKEKA